MLSALAAAIEDVVVRGLVLAVNEIDVEGAGVVDARTLVVMIDEALVIVLDAIVVAVALTVLVAVMPISKVPLT